MHRVSSSRSEFSEAVTTAVARPLGGRAADRQGQPGGRASASTCGSRPTPRCPALDDELSTDVATVVGNLVDNAMDAAAEAPQRWVEVSLGLVDGEVDVVVRDSGAGRAAGDGARDLPPRASPRKAAAAGRTRPGSAASACRWCTWCAPAAAATSPSSSVGGSTFTATPARRALRWWTS